MIVVEMKQKQYNKICKILSWMNAAPVELSEHVIDACWSRIWDMNLVNVEYTLSRSGKLVIKVWNDQSFMEKVKIKIVDISK